MKIYVHFSTENLANVYVVSDNEGNGIIIDPAYIDRELVDIIENGDITIKAIFITHRHESHTAGVGTLMKIYPADIYASNNEIEGFRTKALHDGDRIRIGSLEMEAILVPGHSIDSLVYRIGDAIFTGDTLFSGTIADTKGYIEKSLLTKSIRQRLMSLPDSTLVYPGHGPISKIRIERMFNVDLLESVGRFRK